jgi:AraC-like DNA-binding protein
MPGDIAQLEDALGTQVLAHLAALTEPAVLHGQPVASRACRRRRFPPVDFYGTQTLPSGLRGHSHAWPELALVLEGRPHMGIGDRVYEPQPGDWIVLRPNVPHGECARQTGQTYSLFWFVFQPRAWRIHLTRFTRREGYQLTAWTELGRLPVPRAADVRRLIAQPWADHAQTRRRLLALVSHALEQLAEPSTARHAEHPAIARVRQIIADRPGKPPRLAELAARVGISPNYLSSLFAREMRTTLRQYADQQRIELARQQLLDPARSIKQVAYALGFADPYHFSKVFHRVTGVSPSAFRRAARESGDMAS